VSRTVFGYGDCDGFTSAWATTSRRYVFSACRVASWLAYYEFASYVLDVDGFALVAKLALSSDKVCRFIEMFRSCSLFYAIAKSSEATAGTARQ
jgi:hypothetical protein